MQTTTHELGVDDAFFNLVAGIEELEDLTAPGWFSWFNTSAFWIGWGVGFAVGGLLLT